jgi:hypothetical protein
VYRANYLFRGVEVPSGRNRVEFTYRSRSFRLGLAITIAGATALGGGLVTVGVATILDLRGARRRNRGAEHGPEVLDAGENGGVGETAPDPDRASA